MKKIVVTENYELKETDVYIKIQAQANINIYNTSNRSSVVINNTTAYESILSVRTGWLIEGSTSYILAPHTSVTLQSNAREWYIQEYTPNKRASDFTAGLDVESGTITALTVNSITDATQEWSVNEFVGMAVKVLTDALEEDYCIIASNTANTLTFDCDTMGLTYTTYRILDTYAITSNTMDSVVSLDIRSNDCAVILPLVSDIQNRTKVYIYNEMANNGDHKTVIISRGADRMRGIKYVTLEHQWEGVEMYAHYRLPYHWDILIVENVKRYINARITAPITLDSLTYVPILAEGSSETISAKRFIAKTISGIRWAKYKSVVSNEFLCSGSLQLTKLSGGFSIVEITIRVKKFSDNSIVEFTDEAAQVRMSINQIITVPIHIPFTLNQNDELTLIAKNSDGEVIIDAGTIFTIREY